MANRRKMTIREFNEKYKSHIEDGHYGLSVDHPKVIEYLDFKFENEIRLWRGNYVHFEFSQIKMKFGQITIYCNSPNYIEWEKDIRIMLEHDKKDKNEKA